jgi:hypothetical protein
VKALDKRIDAQEKGRIDLAHILGERSGGALVRGTGRATALVGIQEIYGPTRRVQSESPSSSSDDVAIRQEKKNKARQEEREKGNEKRERRRRRKRRNRKRREMSAFDSSSTSSDTDTSDTESGSDWKGGDNIWPSFESVPFKGPTLTVNKQGDGMLRRALENHPSVSGYVESLQLKQSRNRKEASMLGRMIDFNLAELGIKKARAVSSTEVAIRRLVAITYGDRHSSWDTASHVEDGKFSLLTSKQETDAECCQTSKTS